MTDWYYHAPGAGRSGPFSADAMREHFRQRRIVLDTLVWHAGLREWQPLERQLEALQLVGVVPDTTLPPPLPPRPQVAASNTTGAAPAAYSASRPAAPSSSRRTGCLIVVAIAVAGLVLIAILAAIALPSYRDYVERARQSQPAASGSEQSMATPDAPAREFDADHMASADALTRELVETAMREFYRANGDTCPDTWEFERIQVRDPRLQGNQDGWSGITPAHPDSGQCAYDIQFYGFGPALDQRTLRYEVRIEGETVSIVCRNRDLRPEHLPPGCEG
jgi:hypothetical protein